MITMLSVFAEPDAGVNAGHTLKHPPVQSCVVAVSTSKKYKVLWLDGLTHAGAPATASESGRFPAGAGVAVGAGTIGFVPPPLLVPPPPPPHAASATVHANAKMPNRLIMLVLNLLCGHHHKRQS
jgi:hypothetical protein